MFFGAVDVEGITVRKFLAANRDYSCVLTSISSQRNTFNFSGFGGTAVVAVVVVVCVARRLGAV